MPPFYFLALSISNRGRQYNNISIVLYNIDIVNIYYNNNSLEDKYINKVNELYKGNKQIDKLFISFKG